MKVAPRHWSSQSRFYYRWLIAGIAFVTVALAVTARTIFALVLCSYREPDYGRRSGQR